MYGKCSTRGGVEWQIQHKAKPSAVFVRDLTPSSYCIFHTLRVDHSLSHQGPARKAKPYGAGSHYLHNCTQMT